MYGNCRICGKQLTNNEQTVLVDQCNGCTAEINPIDEEDEI